MQEGKRPIGVGFFFALGHSTVVIAGGAAIAFAAGSVQSRFPGFIETSSAIGMAASACFLLTIGALNTVLLVTVWRAIRQRAKNGDAGQRQLDAVLGRSGLLARLFRRLFDLIARSWHMYPLGFLFGLGFDTASEIGLLGIAASEAAKGLPPGSILVFPALFMAGMSLVDATDGVLMLGVYGWAFTEPRRKLYYNFAVTGFSVVAAVVVGGIEAVGLITQKFGAVGGPWDIVNTAAAEIGVFGYTIVGLFAFAWLVSLLMYRPKAPDRIGA
jgi:high-affinity nickel-transport protein